MLYDHQATISNQPGMFIGGPDILGQLTQCISLILIGWFYLFISVRNYALVLLPIATWKLGYFYAKVGKITVAKTV